MRKACLTVLALFLCLGMVASVPNAWATSYDPTGVEDGHGSVPPLEIERAMLMNQGGAGDALIGPMYRATVSSGFDPFNFVSYVSIENTSNKWVAAHVRLRAGRYSIEVLDFPILLSPRDVFWFQFEVIPDVTGAIQAVRIWSQDTNTLLHSGLPVDANGTWTQNVSPIILSQFKQLPLDQRGLAELTQGYVEVIGLWSMALPGSFAGNFYAVMGGLWGDSTGVSVGTPSSVLNIPAETRIPSYRFGTDAVDRVPALDVQKALTGHVFMGDFTNGLYFGYSMTAIKDFRSNYFPPGNLDDNNYAHRDSYIRGGVNGGGLTVNPATILYNYGSDAAYTDPDWATSFGPTWNDGDDYTSGEDVTHHSRVIASGAVDSWSLDEVDDALVKQRIMSTYFNGGFSYNGAPDSGTYTLAAVTFPTKYLHYFFDITSGLVREDNVVPLGLSSTFPRFVWPVGDAGTALNVRNELPVVPWIGRVAFRAAAWNLDEKSPSQLSPFRVTTFPWEVNFIGIGDLSISRLAGFCFLENDDPNSTFTLLTYPTYPAGWFMMEGFSLGGGIQSGDPRTAEYGIDGLGAYSREDNPLLEELMDDYGDTNIIPALVYMMDWEFTGFSHARAYEPAWDNMVDSNNPLLRAIPAAD